MPERRVSSAAAPTTTSRAAPIASISTRRPETLLYDSNGSAAGGAQVALAVLENGGSVTGNQIHMI
jgi:hypothetical protein